MLLSIIVPTYNVENYIGNCLDSLLSQDLDKKDYEIIVINDGSTDKSGLIANDYANLNENIHVHNQENNGLSAARNQGIMLAQGKYVYFIDSDDYVTRNTLGYILSLLENNQLDVLGIQVQESSVLDDYGSSNLDKIEQEEIIVTDGISFIATHNYLNNAWWYFINREFLLKTKLTFPIGRFVEDANFTANLLAKAKRISSSSLDFYRYYMRPDSIMRKKNIAHDHKMMIDYEKNIYDFSEQLLQLEKVDHIELKDCLKRIKARQQGFTFFLLVRLMKSDIPLPKIDQKLQELRKIDAYPLTKFLGKDYHGFDYSFMVFVFNREYLMNPFIKTFRFFYSLIK